MRSARVRRDTIHPFSLGKQRNCAVIYICGKHDSLRWHFVTNEEHIETKGEFKQFVQSLGHILVVVVVVFAFSATFWVLALDYSVCPR